MNQETIHKYIAGDATAEEKQSVVRWIDAEEKNMNEYLLLSKLHIFSIWQKDVITPVIRDEYVSKNYRKYLVNSNIWKIAAIFLVAFFLGTFYASYIHHTEPDLIMQTVYVPAGRRVKLVLADSTKVWLNAQSKLTYPSRFSEKNRVVSLEGEAFFHVVPNKQSPFIVRSPLLTVKVLGTNFNMCTYLNEQSLITLMSGKVEVETNDHENKVVMKPQEQICYSKTSGLSKLKDVDVSFVLSWVKGESAFVNKRLDEITRSLERKFNIRIDIADSDLAAEVFTCRFKETVAIEEALTILKETRRLDYILADKQVVIYKSKK